LGKYKGGRRSTTQALSIGLLHMCYEKDTWRSSGPIVVLVPIGRDSDQEQSAQVGRPLVQDH
jgi:hypothetical protein